MKKLIIILFMIVLLVGCDLTNTPSSRVSEYLDKYNSLSDEVILDIETKVSNESISNKNKDTYKKVLGRVYGDKAIVIAKISVYDLYKADIDSLNYMNENINEFYKTDNTFDNDLYDEYRLNSMLNTNDMCQKYYYTVSCGARYMFGFFKKNCNLAPNFCLMENCF